jgi:uncharacterized protein YdcH (DUF465 family)
LSFIDDIEIYNDPIISRKRRGDINDPYKKIIETLTVENNGKVVLTEIPNKKERVIVKNGTTYLMETDDNKTLTASLFYVDYPNGIIYFHNSLSNQSLDFTYLGEGARFFPSSRIYLQNDSNGILNAKDKFSDIDRLINEQKARVDVQIQSVPQPYEVVDMRIDRNGTVYEVAKDRIDAEQLKIDNLTNEINTAHTDILNNKYTSIKDRLDTEQQEIVNALKDANNNTFISLSSRFNSIDSEISSITQNITSLQNSLTLKLDSSSYTGEDIVSKIQLTPSNILISASKINLNGAIGINALDSSVLNTVNNAVLKANINLTDTLPTAIALDTNGITAYTSDTTKFARFNQNGLYIKNGAVTIERPDGYKSFDNGVPQNEFSIKGADPPFTDFGISIHGYWWGTTSSARKKCQYYTIKHDARYLKVWVAGYCDAGANGSNVSVIDSGGINVVASKVTFTTNPADPYPTYGEVLTIDMGVPDGQMTSYYVALNAGADGTLAYGRVIAIWKEG